MFVKDWHKLKCGLNKQGTSLMKKCKYLVNTFSHEARISCKYFAISSANRLKAKPLKVQSPGATLYYPGPQVCDKWIGWEHKTWLYSSAPSSLVKSIELNLWDTCLEAFKDSWTEGHTEGRMEERKVERKEERNQSCHRPFIQSFILLDKWSKTDSWVVNWCP